MSRSVCTNKSSMDLMSFENRPMVSSFWFGEVVLAVLTMVHTENRRAANGFLSRSRAIVAPGKLDLPAQTIFPIEITRREVKRDDAIGLRGAGDAPGLRRREMAALGGDRRVLLEECRLYEQLVGTSRERNDALDVRGMVGGIDHIGDFLPGGHAYRLRLEEAKRNRTVRRDGNRRVVRAAAPYGALGLVEPGPDR